MLDDFHGPYEWDNLERQMRKVFPDRRITEITAGPPRVQVLLHPRRVSAGRGHRLVPGRVARGRRAASSPHLRTILDDAGRPMLFINWNTDMGDGWEWSNVEEYPGYLKYTSMAYRMAINEIVYSLTH